MNKKIYFFIFFIWIGWINNAFSSVTLLGNRVIYPAHAQDKTLEFTNNDNTPALVQIWTDVNDPKSSPENKGPFIAIPSIFTIDAKSKQLVKIAYNSEANPDDRESVFYLNYLSIPSVSKQDATKNKLMIIVTNRVKIFYRPKNLSIQQSDVINNIKFERVGNTLKVSNPTPYYATVTTAKISNSNKKHNINIDSSQLDMISPFGEIYWPIPSNYNQGLIKLNFGLINDYGTETKREITIM
ncbi:molecular chaperone [Providencia burhodogranariea]|uniref:Pili assembly chaperone n=1 Tax=Providencia burhodogranariea DSM 19968 TaxID=1141662 RepID=K8WS14_9GAMM|nr:molecular chaperone [Providencia burhodogranariea]EKT60237.1 pili assembly chaperone [Providencia burhodogranariea DSM 19968]